MDNNLIQVVNNENVTTSRLVANSFHKRHEIVTRKIEQLIVQLEGYPQFCGHPLFTKSLEENPQNGQSYTIYYINRDGFVLLAMGFTGAEALEWKLKYIVAFNEMEKKLHQGATDNRLELARLIVQAKPSNVRAIKSLYPEYFDSIAENGSLEYASDLNTSYQRWIEDYDISKEWITEFPTIEIYNNYVRYCIERHLPSMGKKIFYHTLEVDFNLTRRQKTDGYRYFLSA